ncbi:MAG: MFS transporter, partial [OM182 bacterium]|nr:MFS transporter [OM182 bacterium]
MPNMIGTLRDALGRGDQKTLLFLLAIGNTIAFATWQVLLNNFVVEEVAFTGREIGVLQSLREVPGFLAFTAILV